VNETVGAEASEMRHSSQVAETRGNATINASVNATGSILTSAVMDSMDASAESGVQCWGVDYEYGNMHKGSCAWAELVALHCKDECLLDVRQQDWFPAATPIEEVEYPSAGRCQKACAHTKRCDFWVFDLRPGTFEKACWMKRAVTCEGAFGDAPGFISGPALCMSEGDVGSERYVSQKPSKGNSEKLIHAAEVAVPSASQSKPRQQHEQSKQLNLFPWILRLILIFLEAIGGGVCLAAVAGCVVWKCTQEQLKAAPAASQDIPRTSLLQQANGVRNQDTLSTRSKLSETLRNFDAPVPSMQPEPEEEAFDTCPPHAEEEAKAAAYDY